MKKIFALSLVFLSTTALADTVTTLAEAHSQTCFLNQQCQMSSSHDIEIRNDTSVDHVYSYVYSLCDDKGKCSGANNSVKVRAHTVWNNHYNGFLYSTFRWAGSHTIVARTGVTGVQNKESVGNNFVMVN